jgi:hypothetical protein
MEKKPPKEKITNVKGELLKRLSESFYVMLNSVTIATGLKGHYNNISSLNTLQFTKNFKKANNFELFSSL